MGTLQQSYSLLLLVLLPAGGLALRLYRRRPAGGFDRKAPSHREPSGFAVVSGEGTNTEPYPYVYINADGSARELHRGEREYLETPFHGADGGRPYLKSRYLQKDGWGEIKGFLKRTKVPKDIQIGIAPVEDPSKAMTREEHIQFLREKGMVITENRDGSFTATKPGMFKTDI